MKQKSWLHGIRIFILFMFSFPFVVFSQSDNNLTGSNDTLPVFKNGYADLMDYLKGAVKYPDVSKEKGVEGTVVISFIVDERGAVKDEFVSKGADENLDREALRVIHEMPSWNPAIKSNKPVAVRMQLPINFILKAPEKKPEKIHNE